MSFPPLRSTMFAACLLLPPAVRADNDQGLELFEKRIRPALIRHCYECHSGAAKELEGELRLDSRDAIRQGGETGPAVVPGQVSESLLLAALRHESLKMPPDKKLPDGVIADFEKWIELGAPDPRDHPPTPGEVAELSWQSALASRRDWWSLQPVRAMKVPAAAGTSTSDHPVDRFIQSKLHAAGIEPQAAADPQILLRRLSLILTGLPPTLEQVSQFELGATKDRSLAVDELISRLLASPHFGERWARHWMDVVRFAETHGYEWNHEIRDVWQYRDYLIRAFNEDVPYDQFVREHIAGDLLESPRINRNTNTNESVIATAFWRFGELGHDNCVKFPEIRFDALDNQIDTFTKAFQATTVSCARCHDHKFDAVSTRDYYALLGIMESSRQVVQTIDTPQQIASHVERLASLKQKIRGSLADAWLAEIDVADEKILAALQAPPPTEDAKDASPPLIKRLTGSVATADLAAILQPLARQNGDELKAAWINTRNYYREQQAARAKFNAENFELWFSLGPNDSTGWSTSGLGPSERVSQPGGFVVAVEGDAAVSAVLPGGVYTHLLSSKLNGTMQSPWMPGDRKFVSVQFLGGGLSMLRPVTDSCALNEYIGGGLSYLSDDKIKWQTYPTREDPTHRAFLDLTTKSDNVRWPDRPGVAGNNEALLNSPRSWFGVVRAVAHDCNDTPREELTHLLPLFAGEPPSDLATVAKMFRDAGQSAVSAWKRGEASENDVRWINWLLDVELLTNKTTIHHEVDALVAEYRRVEATVPQPRVVAGMSEHGNGFASPVLLRGNPTTPGPLEPRRYLEVISGSRSPFAGGGSGRGGLAEAMTTADNPLTARVMVNRVWHHLFGAGLVRTTDDFGHLGDPPSHPELLDYLSHRFVQEGWSIKKLIRHIVTSRSFQQSSSPAAAARDVDPDNRLLHHFAVRRLDAEAIRDSMLAASGRLDPTLFGASIQPFRAEPKEHRKLYAGPLDGDGRRSLYLKVTRMEGPRFLELFDLPEQTETRGRRDRTNVPAQALALLNDPFVIDQARGWGATLASRPDESVGLRINHVFVRAFGRKPTNAERDRLSGFVDQLADLHDLKPEVVLSSATIWQDVAHAMYNMKEFVFIR